MKLDSETKALIRRLQKDVPVNIVNIAKFLGLQVWESSDLPEGIAGKIFRDDQNGGTNGFSIVVRAQDPVVRKRFTVAHEIAHYLLHRKLFGKELVDDALYRSSLSSPVEAEANALAADLLMPWHLLSQFSANDPGELAAMFEVSEQAMNIRLQTRPSHALAYA